MPPKIESVPPGAKRSSASLYHEALRKADREILETKMEALKEDLDETKKIALGARNKAHVPHECYHEDDIKSVFQAINSFKTLKLGALVAFLVVAAGAIGQYYTLIDKTEDTEQSVKSVESSVAAIKKEVQAVTTAVDTHIEQDRLTDAEMAVQRRQTLEDISRVVEAAVKKSRN